MDVTIGCCLVLFMDTPQKSCLEVASQSVENSAPVSQRHERKETKTEPGTPKPTKAGVKKIETGPSFTCVLLKDGVVDCKGKSSIGLSDVNQELAGKRFADIALLHTGFCGILQNGSLFCNRERWYSCRELALRRAKKYKMISAEIDRVCVVTPSNRLICWSYSCDPSSPCWWDRLTQAAVKRVSTKKQCSSFRLDNVSFVSVGGAGICYIDTRKRVRCFGEDRRFVAATPRGKKRCRKVAVGDRQACAIALDRSLDCWSDSGKSINDSAEPLLNVPDARGPYMDVMAGAGYSCAKRANNTVSCWGEGREAPNHLEDIVGGSMMYYGKSWFITDIPHM